MAKYEDYVQEGTLEDEIEQASTQSEERQGQVPPQFQGKTAEEIAKSYVELEALQARQSNELGELRKTTSTLTEMLQNSQSTATPQQEREPVTAEDLYENPEQAISQVVEERVSARLEGLERELASRDAREAYDRLEERFPGYRETAKTSAMQDWLKESGYRQRLASAADNGDLQAAEDLFSMYDDLTGKKKDRNEELEREQALQDAGLESGRSDMTTPVEKFSRSKLELIRRKAKHGDREAEQYLIENGDSIFRAYSEGRISN
jgi:hypothetical protein